jgi:ABC-type transporter Mla maintaining outer membrane lipid asymmetry permease subunit MlaE
VPKIKYLAEDYAASLLALSLTVPALAVMFVLYAMVGGFVANTDGKTRPF